MSSQVCFIHIYNITSITHKSHVICALSSLGKGCDKAQGQIYIQRRPCGSLRPRQGDNRNVVNVNADHVRHPESAATAISVAANHIIDDDDSPARSDRRRGGRRGN